MYKEWIKYEQYRKILKKRINKRKKKVAIIIKVSFELFW